MAGIKLNKGLMPFDLYFEDIDTHETIYFNPSDSDLPKRLMECKNIIEEKQKQVKTPETDEKGVPKDIDETINYFNETNKVIYDALDYAFDNKVSDVIFKYCAPFSIVNGQYYILAFIEAMIPELKKLTEQNAKKASQKSEKYLAKYRK